ncbi:MAG TPA: MgtC/SapB family protein [Pirellulales bacterium]|jgi:putative Mg2+ transporter-C (MgtC) family protein|nr:MgtC/SapB family protein [Pirellulales bacterium]
MNVDLSWQEIAWRLLWTVLAGGMIGFNREERGHAAGLRTAILVSLAASIAMIQANLLLDARGKAPESFASMDVLRLPLGILSGMGFIGGGAILRHGKRVTGITTAATLWFLTIMGLCFGGGQIVLGLAALGLAMFVLCALKWIDRVMVAERRSRLSLVVAADGPTQEELRERLTAAGFAIASCRAAYLENQTRRLRFAIRWRAKASDTGVPPVVSELAHRPGMLQVWWHP